MADERNPSDPDLGQDGKDDKAYPKKADGSVDVDAMTPEQQAKYWKERSDGSSKSWQAEHDARVLAEDKLAKMGQEDGDLADLEHKAADAATLSEFENLIPNFKQLTPEEQANIQGWYRTIHGAVSKDLDKRPDLQYSQRMYRENQFETTFKKVASQVPGLADKYEDFKTKFFKPDRDPPGEAVILDLGKSFMYDDNIKKAKDEGAEEQRKADEGIDLLDPTGGDKGHGGAPGMSLKDWDYLAKTNPQEFAKRAPEYDKAVASGKLKE